MRPIEEIEQLRQNEMRHWHFHENDFGKWLAYRDGGKEYEFVNATFSTREQARNHARAIALALVFEIEASEWRVLAEEAHAKVIRLTERVEYLEARDKAVLGEFRRALSESYESLRDASLPSKEDQ